MFKLIKHPFFSSHTTSKNAWLAFIILILGLILTGIATFFTHREIESDANQEFGSICNEIKIRTANRLHECEKLLRTGSAFITASDTVSREAWKTFYESSNYQKNLPGAGGLGYSMLIPKNKLRKHIEQIRKEGFPDYLIKPVGERDLYTSIIYIEPFKGHNHLSFGYDMFSEPTRRKAMELARDSDFAVLSGNLSNFQQSEKDQHVGILMVVPVYRKGMPIHTKEQRQAAIKGWVFSPYRMYTLLPGILGRWDLEQENKIHLQIFDERISDSLLLYDSIKGNTQVDSTSRTRKIILSIRLNGGQWLLRFTQSSPQLPFFVNSEILVALSGILISILLYLLLLSFLNTRFRATKIAEKLTFRLKKSRKWLREVLENSQDASYKRNLEKDNYNYLSPVFEKLSGYSTDEMKALPFETFLELIHPEDLEEVRKIVGESLSPQGGNAFQVDYRFKHKNGEYRWFRDKFTVMRNANNKPLTRIGSISDITPRKIAAQSLRNSEEKYRSIFETIQDVFYQVDLHGNILEISPSVVNYTDYSRDELIGTSVRDLYVNLNDRDNVIIALSSNGEVRDYELKIKTKKGIIKDTSVNAKIIYDKNGNPNHIVGLIRDISERKQKEVELRKSEENYRNIYNNALEGMFRTSIDGRTLQANHALALMMGFETPEEAITSVNELNHQIWVDPFERNRYFTLLKEQGIVRGFECQCRRKDGSIFWVAFNAKIIRGNDGKDLFVDGYVQDITERRKADQALRESEERHHTILRTAMDGFWITDMTGRFLEVNETYCRMIGYTMQELLSMAISDIEGNESEHEVSSHIEQIISQGENIFETKHRRKDGSLLEVQISVQYQHFDEGRLITFVHDITNRKNAEKEQKKIQSLLTNSQRLSNLGSWETELSTGNLLWTEEMYRILGFPLNLPINLDMAVTVFPPDELKRFNEAITNALNGNPYNIDYTIRRHNDGQRRIIHDEGEISFDNAGKAVRMFGTTQDITERKESEKRLKLLSTSIEQSPVSVVITDKEGNIEYVNPRFSEVTGYSLAEALGKNPRILKSDNQEKEFYQNLWNTILSGNVWHGEFCNKKKNGEYYWERAAISPIVDKGGHISFFVAVKEDITEMKKILEDLIKAKERAEESDNLKTSFLNNISHEIRTPFNSILGFLSLLQFEDTTQSERDEYIDNINGSANRLMNTINDIVEIAQVQSGQMILTITTINIRSLISDLVSRFKPQAEFKGLVFDLKDELPSSLDLLQTDPVKLSTILNHLIGNAIKFTKSGSINLSVCATGAYLEFCVRDTGVGITENKQQSIFKRFTQADNSNTRQFEGSGLGLSISEAYTEILHGKLWLESVEGIGSSFYLTIPFTSSQIEKKLDSDILSQDEKEARTGKLKILIVEDDESSAKYISIVINSFANDLFIAKSGIEAVEYCRTNPDIDLVFMDIRMPDMDGYEATKQLRQFNSEVIIIAQTAHALAGDMEKAIAVGCNDYIPKPVKKDILVGLIQKYFGYVI